MSGRSWKRYLLLVVFSFGVSLGFSAPAIALSLDEAKTSGLVGEKVDGYLGIVGAPSSEVRALVDSINQQRRAEYQAIAARNGTDLRTVEALAAKKAIERTPPGYFVESSGGWTRK
jgi:hypothetical protein